MPSFWGPFDTRTECFAAKMVVISSGDPFIDMLLGEEVNSPLRILTGSEVNCCLENFYGPFAFRGNEHVTIDGKTCTVISLSEKGRRYVAEKRFRQKYWPKFCAKLYDIWEYWREERTLEEKIAAICVLIVAICFFIKLCS